MALDPCSSLAGWLRGLRTQKTRTVSTVMGVAWGTFAVLALLAFGRGLEDRMRERAAGLGRGIVIGWGQRTAKPFEGYPDGRTVRLTRQDLRALAERIPELEAVSAEFVRYEDVRHGSRVFRPVISGADPDYGRLRSLAAQPGGRFPSDRDEAEKRRVAFLGDRVKEQLFGAQQAVGKTVLLRAIPYTMIGVLRPKLQDSN